MAFSGTSRRFLFALALGAVACVFLLSTFVLTRFSDMFVSPDETANAFFARAFSEHRSFRVEYPVLFDVVPQLHPRAIVSDGHALLPASFLGLPFFYGILMRVFGGWILLFLTPLIAIGAAVAWAAVLKTWFQKSVAILSGFFLLFHPAVWYYSSRSLMHNVLFVSFLIFSAFFLIRKPLLKRTSRHLDVWIAGVCLGSALFVRVSEAFWVIPLFVFLVYTQRADLRMREIIFLCAGCFIPIILLLVLNTQTYGHPFVTGYTFGGTVGEVRNTAEGSNVTAEKFFPFGFHPRAILRHTRDYLFFLFWWLTGLTLIGLPLVLHADSREALRVRRTYTIACLLLGMVLVLWYGSWTLYDNPDKTQITIANSYVRYWLPLFVLSTPFLASALVWISDRARTPIAKKMCLAVCVFVVFWLNLRITFFDGQDALTRVAQILLESRTIREDVLRLIPQDAVIVVDHADKIFFPDRHVLYPFRSEETDRLIPILVSSVPLYYYGVTLPQKDVNFLNEKKLPDDISIEFVKSFGVESLYRFQKEPKR